MRTLLKNIHDASLRAMKASDDKNAYRFGDNGRGKLDIGSWLGIAFFVLSVPLGIATNMLTPRFVSYLEKRKLIKSHRTKEQDLAAYRSIEAFKNGSRDKYPAYIALAVASVICAIGCATCVLLLALKYGGLIEGTILPSEPTVYLSVSAFAFLVFSVLFVGLIVSTARRIERFDEYKAEIRKKWGEDVI
jgi:hypothetical protein